MKRTPAKRAFKILTGTEYQEQQESRRDVGALIILALVVFCAILLCCSFVQASEIRDEDAILAIIGEAENQGFGGMLAVASAIRHRGTLHGVYGLHNSRVVNKKFTKGTYIMARNAWLDSGIEGVDPVYGANSWENASDFGVPYWANSCKQTVVIKDHIFYKCPTPRGGV